MDIKIYTPQSALKNPRAMVKEMWHDLKAARGLAWRLAIRDIRAAYRQSYLGILWAFIQPLAHAITWIFLHGTGIVTLHETSIPYPAYVFIGSMLWSIFMESIQAPLHMTTANKMLLAKINFPREAIIMAAGYQTFFNAAIKILIMFLALLAWRIMPGTSIFLFPFGILSLVFAGMTIGLLLTPVGTLYTDIGKGLPVILQFLMYLTPVVFPLPKAGWAAFVIRNNPVTPLIMSARDWLTGVETNFVNGYLYTNLVMIGVFLIAWILFRLAMPILIERMSS